MRRNGRQLLQCCSAPQASDNSVIAFLGEICIKLADAEEIEWCVHADELVGIGADSVLPAEWCDRRGEHHARCAVRSGDLAGGARGGSGCDAVIDDDRDLADKRLAGTICPVALGACRYLGLLSLPDGGQLLIRDAGGVDDLGIDDPDPVLAHRAHAQFRLERRAELSDDDDIQWCAKCPGNLGCDTNAAARQAQDNSRLAAQVLKPRGELPACVVTISESHDTSLKLPRATANIPKSAIRSDLGQVMAVSPRLRCVRGCLIASLSRS
jgi:hypothetical protein